MKRINVIKYGIELDSKRHPRLVSEDRYRYECDDWKCDDWKFDVGLIARMMRECFRLDHKAEEYAFALAYSGDDELLGVFELTHGFANETKVNARNLMIRMLLVGAQGFVIIHNHPSGDVTPSAADIRLCDFIRGYSHIMGMICMDFLIVGKSLGHKDNWFYSFREEGRMNNVINIDIRTQSKDIEHDEGKAD